MRHRVKGNKIGRTASHRKATLSSLATGLILNKKIKTTDAKARALRPLIEGMITRAKVDSVHNRRIISESINDKEAVKTLFSEIAEKVGDRPGGYTRIVKLGKRQGDAADIAIIELVDFSGSVEKKPVKKRTKKEEVTTPVKETEESEIKDAEVIEETVVETKEESTTEADDTESSQQEKKDE
ncbi:MAG: 50S ribosomal protein L17 [Ignavibacteria bacterium]|nr:50S ribosomal protein L17 [Ignavibacteria bacterium]